MTSERCLFMPLGEKHLDGNASSNEIGGWPSINRVRQVGWTSEDSIVADEICAETEGLDTICWDVGEWASFEGVAEKDLHPKLISFVVPACLVMIAKSLQLPSRALQLRPAAWLLHCARAVRLGCSIISILQHS